MLEPGEMVNCPSPSESLISEIKYIPEKTPCDMTPENIEHLSLGHLLRSHRKKKLIRQVLKEKVVTIGRLKDIINFLTFICLEVVLPAIFLFQPTILDGQSHQPTTHTVKEVQPSAASSRNRQKTIPANGPGYVALISNEIFQVIFNRLQCKTDREFNLELCSEEDNSQTDSMMEGKSTWVAEPLGPTMSSKRSVNSILRERIHFFGKGLIQLVYKMLLDSAELGMTPMSHQSESQEDLDDIRGVANEFLEEVLQMFCQTAIQHLLMDLMSHSSIPDSVPPFNLVYTDALGSKSREEMWDSDSKLSSDVEEKQAHINWLGLKEWKDPVACKSSDSSNVKKQAQRAICEVLLTKMRDILKRTYSDSDELLLIHQKGDDSQDKNVLQCNPDTDIPEDGGDASVISDGSLMPSEDLLEKTPPLQQKEMSLSSSPTVMSPQTLKVIIEGTICQLYASVSRRSRRPTDSFGLMMCLFDEIKYALKRVGISVLCVEDSVEFNEVNAVEAIVKVASKTMSLRSHANRAQLHAACHGDHGSICSMADTFAWVIYNYVKCYWIHFEARRSVCSGWSSSSTEEVLEEAQETTPTEKKRWNSAGSGPETSPHREQIWNSASSGPETSPYREQIWNSAGSGPETSPHREQRRKSAGSAQCSRSFLSKDHLDSTKDHLDSTSTQERKLPITGVSLSIHERFKDEAVEQEDSKSGKGKRKKIQFRKKNKVTPLCTTGPVAVEPKQQRPLLKRITAGLAKLFCFPCKK